jgi:hypothetical protein
VTEQPPRPGAWPVEDPIDLDAIHADLDERERRHVAEAARFEMVLTSVRAQLEEQPSERCVRTAARRWNHAINATAEEVAKQHRQRAG